MSAKILIAVAIVALTVTARADVAPTAEDLYAQGQAAYDRADYAVAIAWWQASYDLSGESGLLFNLAQAERLSGDCARSFATYRRFMAADPDQASEQHKLAEDLTRELAVTCRLTPPDPQPPPQPRPDAVTQHRGDGGRSLRVAGIAIGAGGASVIVAGLILGHHGQTLSNDVTAACAVSCDWATQAAKDASGRSDVAIGRALDVVGVAAIAGGAVAYYLGTRAGRLTVTPRSEGGAALSWSGSW